MPDSTIVPVFPLPIVVFPNEELRLHIYEPRYKQLIKDCSEQNLVFGILTLLENRMMPVGCLVQLTEISKLYKDGRSDVRLQSLAKFEMQRYMEKLDHKLYPGAEIFTAAELETGDHEMTSQVKELFDELCELNRVQPYRSIQWDQLKSYDLGHFVGFDITQEYHFLSLESENERLSLLINQIGIMIEHSRLRSNWIKNIHMNGEFRDFRSEEWK
ncbi:MAG: LON peptidase substrate-binding domain-containing protein [Saprospiraceae bacterium]|nr:LON peptidase substrate-binding domain-containing protein [Saprospiraceae bacterium]